MLSPAEKSVIVEFRQSTLLLLLDDVMGCLTHVEFRDDMGKMNGADFFLRGVINAFHYLVGVLSRSVVLIFTAALPFKMTNGN